jgi:hypothetical protein
MLNHPLVLLALLAPHSAVYVKGHSRAADRTRERLEVSTCYSLAQRPESSDAILEVDHLFNRSGYPRIVMVLLGPGGKVLWEDKTEDDPWPLPSPVNRLLKRMRRSTCPARDPGVLRNARAIARPKSDSLN